MLHFKKGVTIFSRVGAGHYVFVYIHLFMRKRTDINFVDMMIIDFYDFMNALTYSLFVVSLLS